MPALREPGGISRKRALAGRPSRTVPAEVRVPAMLEDFAGQFRSLRRLLAKTRRNRQDGKDPLICRQVHGTPGMPGSYQLTRSVNCSSRDPLPDPRVLTSPFEPTPVGMPGLLNTLNASMLSRTATVSAIRTSLNIDASWPNSHTPGR